MKHKILITIAVVGLVIIALGELCGLIDRFVFAEPEFKLVDDITINGVLLEWGDPIHYCHIDANTIDLDYEGQRWKRVIFIDWDDKVIGDFTRITADGQPRKHAKIRLDDEVRLYCGPELVVYGPLGSNWELDGCPKCGVFVQTVGSSFETDRIMELDCNKPEGVIDFPASDETPAEFLALDEHEYCRKRIQLRDEVIDYLKEGLEDAQAKCQHSNIDESNAMCTVYHGDGSYCLVCPDCGEYVKQ